MPFCLAVEDGNCRRDNYRKRRIAEQILFLFRGDGSRISETSVHTYTASCTVRQHCPYSVPCEVKVSIWRWFIPFV